MTALYGPTETTLDIPSLIADGQPVVLKKTLAANAGAARVAGTVLGRITAGGQLEDYVAGHEDGTEHPVAILLEAVPISAVAVEALVGFAGVYREDGLTGFDAAGGLLLEARGIYTK